MEANEHITVNQHQVEKGYTPYHEDGPSKAHTIWQQVKEKRDSKQYSFERFETAQLLNLCLLQDDIRVKTKQMYQMAERSPFPVDDVRAMVEEMRPQLKDYNETLIAFHEVLSYPKMSYKSMTTKGEWDRTIIEKVPLLMTDLRGELESDGVRKTIKSLFPTVLKQSDRFSCGARRELRRWQRVPDYTRDRAEEWEDMGWDRLVDHLARALVAFFGGVALLAPMIIMVFSGSRNANIIITSVFVLFFGFVLSIGSRASNQEILGATAGYAAVLVVFIGTSGAGS